MCTGVVEKIYHENIGIYAFKVAMRHVWSPDLDKLTRQDWVIAHPRIITPGGGSGLWALRGYRSSLGSLYTKRVEDFLRDDLVRRGRVRRSFSCSTIVGREEIPLMLSGWHAYFRYDDALRVSKDDSPIKAISRALTGMKESDNGVYVVRLRGIIQEAGSEVSGSEMKVLGKCVSG